jgi:hypothetical protein
MAKKDLINHVVFLLDASGSMSGRENAVMSVLRQQVDWLVERGDQFDQENRVPIYTFDSGSYNVLRLKCPVFDMDVKRLQGKLKNRELGHFYTPAGGTPLIEATTRGIKELGQTCQLYGDHAFLFFALTDGGETDNRYGGPALAQTIKALPDNWTLAALVPDVMNKLEAERYGFPSGNIAIWNTNSATGVAEMGAEVKAGLDNYSNLRSRGQTQTGQLFAPTTQQVQANLKPLDAADYLLLRVIPTKGIEIKIPAKSILKSRPEGLKHVEIQAFVEANGHKYVTGKTFYEVIKSEKIDGNKAVIVVDNETGLAYTGPQARALVGLDPFSRRVKPVTKDAQGKQKYSIFVQSTSVNRLLQINDSRVLVIIK